jgi:mRNA-degrading endonuclease RelE of RelBE toxin-antitoxin system
MSKVILNKATVEQMKEEISIHQKTLSELRKLDDNRPSILLQIQFLEDEIKWQECRLLERLNQEDHLT